MQHQHGRQPADAFYGLLTASGVVRHGEWVL
ncbi:hypothetical protein SEEA9517_14207 [Salmonella enterica subsp. enterica serovar Agona str. 400095 17]|nr:hypothetical protein SEEACDC5_21040 [Salmonella enterica subsp. enterica serovar Agona str. SA-5]ESB87769.1 hypothetical protein SEEACDC4_20148 [Salmonella enterica subsp. enterica serovar Agona str. SA-4]ESB90083.1 hypothetical protein SEEAA707_14346 [Salmonella enterica subsp. enterica serovar Agona str. ATCC BAA-707]ESC05363.1 hypothetical protein SEPB61_01389 [Salmonella enterica subsp. enterica serovar Paratyphi B str. SARA61]ESC46565.1 hypothetical protein SEEACDC3_07139 [Salmonella en